MESEVQKYSTLNSVFKVATRLRPERTGTDEGAAQDDSAEGIAAVAIFCPTGRGQAYQASFSE